MTRESAARGPSGELTRERPVNPAHACFLVIDVQRYSTAPGEGEYAHIDPQNVPENLRHYFERIENAVIPNISRLQKACRARGVEVMFTVIEQQTLDGRDRGLDYKISGISVPKGSTDAHMPAAVAPAGDEIVIPKTSSSVFNSTNIDYVLRNLEIDYVIMAGLVTDQCVETAVRDACDRGFLVTLVEDACATYTAARHENSLKALKGYCRRITTDALIEELSAD